MGNLQENYTECSLSLTYTDRLYIMFPFSLELERQNVAHISWKVNFLECG